MANSVLRWAALALALAVPLPAAADGTLRALATGDDGRGWEAVGRINIGQDGYCTGALIAPDLVLTAAHCLYNPDTGGPIEVATLEFAAGWRNGRAEAFRRVRRAAMHPAYIYEGQDKVGRVGYDLALLELDRPIRHPAIRPFGTARTAIGDEVGIVSYATGRDEVPSIEHICRVLAHASRVLMVSCHVDFGASGAPVFALVDGEPRIVSVVSAKAESNGRPVALAAEVGATLEEVRDELAGSDGVFTRAPAARTVVPASGDTPQTGGGARFVRP